MFCKERDFFHNVKTISFLSRSILTQKKYLGLTPEWCEIGYYNQNERWLHSQKIRLTLIIVKLIQIFSSSWRIAYLSFSILKALKTAIKATPISTNTASHIMAISK